VIYTCKASGNFATTFVSKNVLSQLGYGPERFIADPSFALKHTHPDDAARMRAEMRCLLKHGRHVREYRFRHKDGTYRWVRDEARLVRDAAGKPLEIIGCCIDVTERKRAEQALRESEEKYRLLFNSGSDAVFLHEGGQGNEFAYRFIAVNDVACRRLGYTREELLSMRVVQVDAPETIPNVPRIAKLVRENRGATWEGVHLTKDGRRIPVEITNHVFELSGKQVVLSTARDITARKQAEAEHRQTHEQLRALAAKLETAREEERTRIAREIHDELGQALTGVQMNAAWIHKQLRPGNAAQTEALRGKTAEMLRMVSGMIQMVQRISSELRPGVLDHLGLVAAIAWQAEQFRKRTGMALALRLPVEEVALDPTRTTAIFRAFQEVLTNVARHAKATRVEVALRATSSELELEVRDNGRGITAKEIGSPKSLGLLGMRERVAQAGGAVEIRGKSGQGTTVRITTPRTAGFWPARCR
jgi:PAS domain S-box-containing protein